MTPAPDARRAAEALADYYVTVCDKCLCASCWQGVSLCDESATAGIKDVRASELRKLAKESPDYYSREKMVDLFGTVREADLRAYDLLASECYCKRKKKCKYCEAMEEMDAALSAARAAGMEDAAKVCDALVDSRPSPSIITGIARQLAAAIRALPGGAGAESKEANNE